MPLVIVEFPLDNVGPPRIPPDPRLPPVSDETEEDLTDDVASSLLSRCVSASRKSKLEDIECTTNVRQSSKKSDLNGA